MSPALLFYGYFLSIPFLLLIIVIQLDKLLKGRK